MVVNEGWIKKVDWQLLGTVDMCVFSLENPKTISVFSTEQGK